MHPQQPFFGLRRDAICMFFITLWSKLKNMNKKTIITALRFTSSAVKHKNMKHTQKILNTVRLVLTCLVKYIIFEQLNH